MEDKDQVKYICTGTCGGVVTEAEFMSGKNVCATDGCPMKGKPLARRYHCHVCGVYYQEGETHTHA